MSDAAKVKKNTLITTVGLTKKQQGEVLVNKYIEFKATEIVLKKADVLGDEIDFASVAAEDENIKGAIEALVAEYSAKMGITSTTTAKSKVAGLFE